MYSIDDTRSKDYRIGYAWLNVAIGPWTYRGVIIQKGASFLGLGHNSVANVPGKDNWYIVYHRFANPNGNRTHWETTFDGLYFDNTTRLILPVKPTLTSVGPI